LEGVDDEDDDEEETNERRCRGMSMAEPVGDGEVSAPANVLLPPFKS
jgi:hypothetical protein